ncbi:MAG: transcriptional repressor [Chloroflexi bacterium]|nr:transcriptional repressor [Chloroflexota bacterium]
MPTDTATWAERLRGAGLRVTAPRLAVLDALADTSGHPGAGRIAEAARVRLGTLSTQAVYNVLHTLVAAGLIRRIEPAGSPARYETRVADNHHHIVCRSCAATTDVECAVGAAPCLDPSSTNGFLLDEAEVTFWGLCPRCREDGADDGAAHVGPAERVVHAKGGGAHGVVEVTADVT